MDIDSLLSVLALMRLRRHLQFSLSTPPVCANVCNMWDVALYIERCCGCLQGVVCAIVSVMGAYTGVIFASHKQYFYSGAQSDIESNKFVEHLTLMQSLKAADKDGVDAMVAYTTVVPAQPFNRYMSIQMLCYIVPWSLLSCCLGQHARALSRVSCELTACQFSSLW